MQPEDFVRAVWSQQGSGYGFICSRRKDVVGPGSWEDKAFHFPHQAIRIPDADECDIYFTPNLFGRARRSAGNMLPSRWLYADLDHINPFDVKEEWEPSVAWSSSPERFQGLWLIGRPLPRDTHQKINKQLSYALGADKSGWDTTQVLRIPGTRNHKYPDQPKVELLYFTEDILGRIRLPKLRDNPYLPGGSADAKTGSGLTVEALPLGVRRKLSVSLATGDRSRVLFRLECSLLEKGFTAYETYGLLQGTVWNKFEANTDGTYPDLLRDVLRAQAYLGLA